MEFASIGDAFTTQKFALSIAMGFLTLAITILGLIAVWGVRLILWWIDDYEGRSPNNPVSDLVAKLRGYNWTTSHRYERVKNGRNQEADSLDMLVIPAILGFLVSPAWYLYCTFPTILWVASILIVLAFMARSGRRLQKVLQKHIVDPNAHNRE